MAPDSFRDEGSEAARRPWRRLGAKCSIEQYSFSCHIAVVPSEKIIQLHQALADRGFSVCTWSEEEAGETLIEIPALPGGLAHGELGELWAEGSIGSGLAVREIMRAAVAGGHFLALVDGPDGFDPCSVEAGVLKRMLWVRAKTVEYSIKAADLLLRDGNLPLVLVQLRGLPMKSLKRVPSQHWYRLQRLAKDSGTACLVVTPAPMVPSARKRWAVGGDFNLDDLERENAEVIERLRSNVQWRQGSGQREPLVSAAAS